MKCEKCLYNRNCVYLSRHPKNINRIADCSCFESRNKLRAEAVKEFAERLCEDRVSNDPVVIAVKVELKEMVGEG